MSKVPYTKVCIPDPNNAGARIVGFRIRPGDDAWGEMGISEPLFWLDGILGEAADDRRRLGALEEQVDMIRNHLVI